MWVRCEAPIFGGKYAQAARFCGTTPGSWSWFGIEHCQNFQVYGHSSVVGVPAHPEPSLNMLEKTKPENSSSCRNNGMIIIEKTILRNPIQEENEVSGLCHINLSPSASCVGLLPMARPHKLWQPVASYGKLTFVIVHLYICTFVHLYSRGTK